MSPAFAWSPVFETGLHEVDEQHQRLVRMINLVAAQASTPGTGALPNLVDELVAYAAQHFEQEERLMAAHALAPSFVAGHVAQHRAFVAEVQVLRAEGAASGGDLSTMQRFLASWLAFHILGTDRAMATQIELVDAGATPEDALERARHGAQDGAAVQPLLDALSSLYGVLSSRKEALQAQVAERTAQLEIERNALAAALAKMERSQSQLLQSEKMAAIGQLAAGVAHEINNPVGYVRSNLGTLGNYVLRLLELVQAQAAAQADTGSAAAQARLAQATANADLDYLRQDVVALLQESQDGLGRVTGIVCALKDFSRVDQVQWQPADLNRGIESTLNVVWSEIKYKADIVREFGVLPPVPCIAAQINQVFMNLLINAAQAIEGRGTITLRTRVDGEQAVVEITDTGRGIGPESLARIFEPFYTTKPVGKGTGLGLSIAWDIVQRHRGSLAVRSTPGHGACFELRLPLANEPAAAADDHV